MHALEADIARYAPELELTVLAARRVGKHLRFPR
jgi:hypothetical protein